MKFIPYEAADGWRWRLVAPNGRTVADSGEAYTRRTDVERAIRTVVAGVVALASRMTPDGPLEPWE